MKTLYLLLALSLSFSFSNAQSTKLEKVIVIDVDAKSTITLEPFDIKKTIVRTSDIKIFFNRERKEKNITLLFPLISKIRKA